MSDLTLTDAKAREIAQAIVADMTCAACGAMLPNPDCAQAKNAYDAGQQRPCSPPGDLEDAITTHITAACRAGIEAAARWHEAQPYQEVDGHAQAARAIRGLAVCLPPSTAEQTLALIDQLRAGEGNSVEICCDNPDFNGQPNCRINVTADWTDWMPKGFAGDTLLAALEAAARAADAAGAP